MFSAKNIVQNIIFHIMLYLYNKYYIVQHLTMKTTARYLSKKKLLLKSILTKKIKSTVNRYKRCRLWLTQGLKRIASWSKEKTSSTGQPRIKDIFCGLDENRDSLVQRLNVGQDLYPNCDTSIWLRNCTHEITSPIQGTIEGK